MGNWFLINKKNIKNIALLLQASLLLVGCSTAYKDVEMKANAGDVESQLFLARAYRYGDETVTNDLNKAFRWYRLAAEQGNTDAQEGLGWCYLMGWGVKKNFESGIQWIKKSADLGNAKAMGSLGFIYSTDEYGVKDVQKEVKWYLKSAENGDSFNYYRLGNLYFLGAEVDRDPLRGIEYYRKAAEGGICMAAKKLSIMYFNGNEWVSEDKTEAIRLLDSIGESGLSEEAKILKLLMESGIEKIPDDGETVKGGSGDVEWIITNKKGKFGYTISRRINGTIMSYTKRLK